MSTNTGYSNLRAAPGVDWRDVNPHLLAALNAVLRKLGVVGTIISGYRTPAHSVAVGGFANDPHTRHDAVDVMVGSVPVGLIPGATAALTAAGLVSGNQPNFFHGKPDPGHVQLGGSTAPAPPGPARAPAAVAGGGAGPGAAPGAGCLPATLLMFAIGTCGVVEAMLHFVP